MTTRTATSYNRAKKSEELYYTVHRIFKEITEIFNKIESGEYTYEENKIEFLEINNKLKSIKTLLPKIDLNVVSLYVDEDKLTALKNNIRYMLETVTDISYRLEADQYVSKLRIPLKQYFSKINEDPRNYKRWAEDEETLIKKFTAALLDPEEFELYKNYIKRIIVGTLSPKQFKQIYNTLKYKMTPLPKRTFESFNEYKKILP